MSQTTSSTTPPRTHSTPPTSAKPSTPEETINKLHKTVQQVLDSIEQMSDQVVQVRSSVKNMFEVMRNHTNQSLNSTATSNSTTSSTSTSQSSTTGSSSSQDTTNTLTYKLFTHARDASQAIHHLSHTYQQNQSILDSLLQNVAQGPNTNAKAYQTKLLSYIVQTDDLTNEYEQTVKPDEDGIELDGGVDNETRGKKRSAPSFIRTSDTSANRQTKKQKLKRKSNEVPYVRAIIPQHKWSAVIHEDPSKLFALIQLLNRPLSQLYPPARIFIKYHSLFGLPQRQDPTLRMLHVSVGEGVFHAFVTVMGKDLNPVRVQIFGMNEKIVHSTASCITFDDDKKKVQRDVEQHLNLHPQEQSKHHVFNMVSQCCGGAIKFYQNNKDTADAQLQCLILYLVCYEKIFMDKCTVCGKLLHLDSETAGFVPPMRSYLFGRPIHVQCVPDMND
jgi:uncharacterized protein YoxC